MKKKYLGLLLRLVISFGLLGYFLYSQAREYHGIGGALKNFVSTFSGASAAWLIPAGLLHLVGFSLNSLRWKILLKAQGAQPTYKKLFSYYFMAAFFNMFLPTTIGGDTVRALETRRFTGSTATSVMVVIVERLTGLMALVVICATALFIKLFGQVGQYRGVSIFLVAVIAGLVMMMGLLHPKVAPSILGFLKKVLPGKIQAKVEQAYAAVAAYYRQPSALLGALGVSLVFEFNMVVYYFLIARGLHQTPDLLDFMLKVPVMLFLLMTVPAINGLGVRTASFKELMQFPTAYALAIEGIDVAFRLVYGLLGGVFFLFYRRSASGDQDSIRSL